MATGRTKGESHGKQMWYAVIGGLITAAVIAVFTWCNSVSSHLSSIDTELKGITKVTDCYPTVIERLTKIETTVAAAKGAISQQLNLNVQVRLGEFKADNKISDDPLTFEWGLAEPIEPTKLVSMVAEPTVSVPGISMTARCVKNGKACQMTVRGPKEKVSEMVSKLDSGLPGKVTITMAGEPAN